MATVGEASDALALIGPGELDTPRRGVSESTRDRIKRSSAENTRTAYRRAWATWEAWCAREGWPAEPATADQLADYVNSMCEADPPLSLATCRLHMSAIRTHHRAADLEPPGIEPAKAVLRTEARDRAADGEQQRQAVPVIVDALRKMVETCNGDGLIDTRDRALLLLGIAIFARRSELAALNWWNLHDAPEGLVVRIAASKTDKMSLGVDVPVLHGSFSGTDPVRAVARWREALHSRGIDHGRVFRSIDGGIGPQLSTATINEIVQYRAGLAGLGDHLDPDRKLTHAERGQLAGYSAHSLRAGGATIAYMNGAPVAEICRLGRWVAGSSVVLRYIRAVDQWKNHPFRGVL